MEKSCSSCGATYWARWRNEPVTLCPSCKLEVRVCARCRSLDRPPPDPLQLVLFPLPRPVGRLELPDDNEKYVTLRYRASRRVQCDNPYQ